MNENGKLVAYVIKTLSVIPLSKIVLFKNVTQNDNRFITEEKYVIEYRWKERDTKEKGIYQGWFTIDFNGNISEEGVSFPEGRMITPISEDLIIYIK